MQTGHLHRRDARFAFHRLFIASKQKWQCLFIANKQNRADLFIGNK